MNNRQDDPRDKSFGFKYVDQILNQTNDLIKESKGDYPRICFGLAYVASSIALDQNKKIPLMGVQIILSAFLSACDKRVGCELEEQLLTESEESKRYHWISKKDENELEI